MKVRGLLFPGTALALALVTHVTAARAEGACSVTREVSNVDKAGYTPAFSRYVDADLDLPWGLVQTDDPCNLFASLSCHGDPPPLAAGAALATQVQARRLLWAANHDSHVLTVYDDQGAARTSGGQPITVTVDGAPTGLVYNARCDPTIEATGSAVRYTSRCDAIARSPTGDFDVGADGAFAPSFLLVAARDGKVYGWNPGIDAARARVIHDDSATEADYLGLALDPVGAAVYLADFHGGHVVAYDRTWRPIDFVDRRGLRRPWLDDPSIPPGFAPSNVAFVGDRLFVTYGKQGPAGAAFEAVGPTAPGAFYSGAHGLVVAFTLHADGTYGVEHLQAPDRALDAPWAIVLDAGGFGGAGARLYIGNFGDGYINAFDPETLEYRGRLGDSGASNGLTSSAVRLPGLRGLQLKPTLGLTPNADAAGTGGRVDRLFYNATLSYDAGSGADTWSVFGFISGS